MLLLIVILLILSPRASRPLANKQVTPIPQSITITPVTTPAPAPATEPAPAPSAAPTLLSDPPKKFARAKTKTVDLRNHPRNQKKPAWVITATLQLIAISKKGCRTVANLFNQKYAERGVSISKSYVSELRKKSKELLIKMNKRLRKPARRKRANWQWAMDYTEVKVEGERINLIGIIDTGSRRNLELCMADKSANTLEVILTRLFALHGKPKFIKSDNDGSFISEQFKIFLANHDIVHRKSEKHAPWQNGSIERFFGTFKEALATIKIEDVARLQQAIGEFVFFYNNIRTHQNLAGITPMAAWRGYPVAKEEDLVWYSNWNGELCGWYNTKAKGS